MITKDDLDQNIKYEDSKLLDIMLADMEQASSIYKPTNFWSIFLPNLINEIRDCGISAFRRQQQASQLYVPAYPDDEIGKMEALCDYKIFLAADIENQSPILTHISESQVGSPSQQFIFDNKYYSRSMLNYLRGLVFLKKNVDTSNIRTVLEIGGGFGTLGEIFLKSGSALSVNSDLLLNYSYPADNTVDSKFFYVNIDIPPLSYISTRYLQDVFGKENIADYNTTRDMEYISIDELSSKYRAAILCPWQLPNLKGEFDLFVNFFSFQEMEPDVVENYANFINKLVTKYILLRNQKDGKQVAKKAGDVGVLNPVSRDDYVKFFKPFEVVNIDSKIFGNQKNGFESEVIIFKLR